MKLTMTADIESLDRPAVIEGILQRIQSADESEIVRAFLVSVTCLISYITIPRSTTQPVLFGFLSRKSKSRNGVRAVYLALRYCLTAIHSREHGKEEFATIKKLLSPYACSAGRANLTLRTDASDLLHAMLEMNTDSSPSVSFFLCLAYCAIGEEIEDLEPIAISLIARMESTCPDVSKELREDITQVFDELSEWENSLKK